MINVTCVTLCSKLTTKGGDELVGISCTAHLYLACVHLLLLVLARALPTQSPYVYRPMHDGYIQETIKSYTLEMVPRKIS